MKRLKYPLQWFSFLAIVIGIPTVLENYTLDYYIDLTGDVLGGVVISIIPMMIVISGLFIIGVNYFNCQDATKKI